MGNHMKILRTISRIPIAAWAVAVALASSGVINVIATNIQVSKESLSAYRWEPSTAVGSTWAATWNDIPTNGNDQISYVSAWGSSGWQGPVQLSPSPAGVPTTDVNLSWDSTRSRFVFTLLDRNDSIWYGYSTDSSGTQWVYGNQDGSGAPQPVATGDWDYPSIAVDSSGRVIIGGVNMLTASGDSYWTAVSSDGQDFSAPNEVPTAPGAEAQATGD